MVGSLILTRGLGTGTLPGPGSLILTGYLGGGSVVPPTPPVFQAPPKPKPRRRGSAYDPDLANEYIDEDIVAENIELQAQTELDNLSTLTDIDEEPVDTVNVQVVALETQVVLKSVQTSTRLENAQVGVNVGQVDTTTSPSTVSVSTNTLDVDVTIDDGSN